MTTSSESRVETFEPYGSLLEMRAIYNNLAHDYGKALKESSESNPPAELLEHAEDFVARGRETGTLLDDPDERLDAQNMLNFWAKILYRYNRAPEDEPPSAALSPFGSGERARLENATVPFQAPPAPDVVYVGRESFLSDLKQQLLGGRNIALCSLPGAGKTLIATKLAHDPEVREKYSDGVLWARLGEEPDLTSILRMWGEALAISPNEMEWYIDREHAGKVLRQALAQRRMLLVIEDAWQLGAATALKLGGPNCVHIVTTYFMSVALDFDPQGAVTVPGLSDSEGVRLLEERAPNAVKGREGETLALVRALDNSPLALSLVASFCNSQSLHSPGVDLTEMLNHLIEETRVIAAEQPNAVFSSSPGKVQTPASLLATIDWCFHQLSVDRKYVLRAFSSLPPKPNSFSDAAARYITDNRSDSIDTLLDCGLLERISPDRYALHRAVSDYLKRQRHADPDHAAEHRMATFFVNLVKETGPDLTVFAQEERNILAALDTAYEHGLWQQVVEGTNALSEYFDQRGLYALAKMYLARAREAAQTLGDQHSVAVVLLKLGQIGERRSEYAEAREHLKDSLGIARRLGDSDIRARALQSLGVVELALAELPEAAQHLKEALQLADERGDARLKCLIETNLGWMERGLGNFEGARERAERALTLAYHHNYSREVAELELSLGVLDYLQQNYEGARDHDLKGLQYADGIPDKRLQCGLHQALGGVEMELGNFEKAEEHLMKSLHLSVEIGHRWYNSVIWKEIGKLRLRQQRPTAAASAFKRSLDLAQEAKSPERIASALYGLSRAAALQGNYAEARLQSQTSLNIYQVTKHFRTPEVQGWVESLAAIS